MFFGVAPFCSCPASLVSRNFFAVGPGCAKCFFLLRSVGRREISAGPEHKKKTPPRVFFFLLRPRGKAREGEAPLEAGTGPEQKKTPPRVFFFLLRPRRKAREGEAPLEAGTGLEQKKTPTRVFFFCSGPGERQGKEKPRGPGARLWPRAGFQRFSFPCLSPGPQQKKNTLGGVVFFALAPCRLPTGLLLSPVPQQKKHPGWCFLFCCGPARTLTHSLRAWVAMPPPRRGGVFFFAAAPPGPGWCFFFAVAPPGRSLTHGGLGRFRQGPGGVFFCCCGPAGSF